MNRQEQLNMRADELAMERLAERTRIDGSGPVMDRGNLFSSCCVYLLHQGRARTSREDQLLQEVIPIDEMRQYLKKRNGWSDITIEAVDWDAKAAATTKMKATEQRFACKLACDWLPLGKRQKQAKLHERANCPRCDHAVEDLEHLLKCEKANEWRT
jgi:hypothetical protein